MEKKTCIKYGSDSKLFSNAKITYLYADSLNLRGNVIHVCQFKIQHINSKVVMEVGVSNILLIDNGRA